MSGLSGWPDGWDEKPDRRRTSEIITVEFADEMFVAVVTDASIGLKHTAEDREVAYWIPISLIDGPTPERGTWIATIDIPEWKADELEI